MPTPPARDSEHGVMQCTRSDPGFCTGSKLIQLDLGMAFGWDPPWWKERSLHEDLFGTTRSALWNWLRNRAGTIEAAAVP